jgi:hypothetical protein
MNYILLCKDTAGVQIVWFTGRLVVAGGLLYVMLNLVLVVVFKVSTPIVVLKKNRQSFHFAMGNIKKKHFFSVLRHEKDQKFNFILNC